MFSTAEAVDAATFQSWGAPIEIVDHDELMDRALERAEVIASRSRYALTLAKQSLNGCEGLDIRRGYELEQSFTVRLSEHPDSKAAVEQRLAAMAGADRGFGGASRIRASLPYLLGVPAMVRHTDLVATVPRRLLRAPVDLEGIVVLEPPDELPKVAHSMWWHPRFDRDPAHQWLRGLVRAGFA